MEKVVGPHARRTMVIDDLADRPHDCDLLLDQDDLTGDGSRYAGLLNAQGQQLLGPRYALLRPEFAAARKKLRERDGRIGRIMVFFGGIDKTNETTKALQGLADRRTQELAIEVVIGENNRHLAEVKAALAGLPSARLHRQIANMAEMMASVDLALGAGGTTIWERCALGLPCLATIVADNQKEIVQRLGRLGVLDDLGEAREIAPGDYRDKVVALIDRPDLVKAMGRRAFDLVDALGTERVAEKILAGDKNTMIREGKL